MHKGAWIPRNWEYWWEDRNAYWSLISCMVEYFTSYFQLKNCWCVTTRQTAYIETLLRCWASTTASTWRKCPLWFSGIKRKWPGPMKTLQWYHDAGQRLPTLRSVSDSLEAFKMRIQRLGLRPRRGPPVHSRAHIRLVMQVTILLLRKIFFAMIQQIFIFFQLLGHQTIYFTFAVIYFNYYLEDNYLFQQLAAINYLFYHLLALNYLFQKYPCPLPFPLPLPWRWNGGPLS